MRRAALIVPLALLFTASAAADGGRGALLEQRRAQLRLKWEQQFRAADRDQNRALSREEVAEGGLPPALAERFDEIDRDHSASLTPEELMAIYERRLTEQATPKRPRH